VNVVISSFSVTRWYSASVKPPTGHWFRNKHPEEPPESVLFEMTGKSLRVNLFS